MSRTASLSISIVLAVGCGLLSAPGCARAGRRPQGQTLSIYITRYNDSLLFATAAAVGARKAVNPGLWLVWGNVFGDRIRTVVTDGEWQVRLLDRSGVDAVLAGPEWLGFGTARARRLVDMGRFYVLTANLLDSTGQSIGHPFLVRRLSEVTVGLAAVTLDSADVLLRPSGAGWASPGLAARKMQALVGQRADVVVLAYASTDSVRLWVADGVVPMPEPAAGRVVRVDLDIVSATVVGFRVEEEDVTSYLTDASVGTLSDSVHRSWSTRTSPAAPLPKPGLNAARSQAALVKAMLKSGEMDGFLVDSALFRTGLEGGQPTISQAELADRLSEPGRFALLSFTGSELRDLRGLTFRPGLSLSNAGRAKTYKVGATLGFLRRHPELAARGFAFSERPLWTTCFSLLESRAIK